MSVIYTVVFKGEILEGFQPFSVKAHMASLLKADQKQITILFSGKQIVIKKTADKEQALKLGSALKKVGADVKVRAVTIEGPAPDGELSLAPNTGFLISPKPEPPPPNMDISGLSVLPVGEGVLAQPREIFELELDLSEYSIAEAGVDVLDSPREEVAEIEAPDFSLDEPGAVLETLKPDVEELNPDISALSLAVTGTDLLDPSDRAPKRAPAVPDTSGISLVPNSEA